MDQEAQRLEGEWVSRTGAEARAIPASGASWFARTLGFPLVAPPGPLSDMGGCSNDPLALLMDTEWPHPELGTLERFLLVPHNGPLLFPCF